MSKEPSIALNALAKEVIGAAIEVHRILGPGFLENVYECALIIELELRDISCEKQVEIAMQYKGREIGSNRLDLLVDRELIVELKAVDQLLPIHQAQVISYLKATGCQLALLMNFNTALLKNGIKRVVLT